jgi:hypothetical protein
VISKAHANFWACFNALPAEVQRQARKSYELWRGDTFHSSLHFKPVLPDVWSVRVNDNYRALGRRRGGLIVWFWIGSHAEYDALLKRLG